MTTPQPVAVPPAVPRSAGRPRYLRWLDGALMATLLLLAFAAPLATKATVTAFRAAVLLWLLRLILDRRRRPMLPLAAPLFAFLGACAVASALSYAPLLSWGRMRSVTVLLLAILLPEVLTEIRQLKWLTLALLAGCAIATGWTGWNYAAGIGVRMGKAAVVLRPTLRPGDIVESVDGRGTRTPAQWQHALASAAQPQVRLVVLRRVTDVRDKINVDRSLLQRSGLTRPGAVTRARPQRAAGFFYSYIPFSEVLMMAGLFLAGLLSAGAFPSRWAKLLASFLFLGLLAALIATATRAPLALLLAGSFLVFWVGAGRRMRPALVVLLLGSALAVTLSIHRQRGLSWISDDPGTQYRLLMWRDGLRMIPQHPLFGVGFDSVVGLPGRWHMEAYQRFPNLRSHFHSVPLQLAVEGGLVTLAAWIWLLTAWFLLLWRMVKRSRAQPSFAYPLALGLLAAAAGFTLISLVHYSFGDAEVMVIFWLFLGMSAALASLLRSGRSCCS